MLTNSDHSLLELALYRTEKDKKQPSMLRSKRPKNTPPMASTIILCDPVTVPYNNDEYLLTQFNPKTEHVAEYLKA